MESLQEILNQRNLSALFQPIMNLSDGSFLGYEGLIRGPADSPLHSPVNLFNAAKQQGLTLEVEMLCRQIVLKSFYEQNLPGCLFLNVSPETLLHPSFKDGRTLAYLEQLGIDPKRVIIEITENQPTFDYEAVRNALLHYRSMGFQIALDDMGAGFSNLRLWSELRPEFIKIDMHFVQDINTDPLKQQFVKSIQQIALSSGTQVMAEGIETAAELRVIRNIGINCGQGYFIARPAPIPILNPPAEVGCLIDSNYIVEQPANLTRSSTVETLLRYVESFHPDTAIEELITYFCRNPALRAIPIVIKGRPTGLINRQRLFDPLDQIIQSEVKKTIFELMNIAPLLVEKSTPIHELAGFLSESDIQNFVDGFIVTEQGRYLGLGSGQDLLREITRAHIETARYANPLTQLSGKVPVDERIKQLLHTGKPFAICHANLDNFSPFNNEYGYHKGDELIQFTGKLLGKICHSKHDFIGHIHGDHFTLIMQSPDWQLRCNRALSVFAQTSTTLFNKAHRGMGGYKSEDRQGRIVHHPLPTLSLGAAWINPQQHSSHHKASDAASAAMKMAKLKPGNSLFIERRNLQHSDLNELSYG